MDRKKALAIGVLILLYIAITQIGLLGGGFCAEVANDYCGYWRIGTLLAQGRSFAEVYLLQLAHPEWMVVPYLPIFLAPLRILALLSPSTGFLLWTLCTLVATIAYLRFFTTQTTGKPLAGFWTLLLLLSLPSFWSLYAGQINILPMIIIGEFFRLSLQRKDFQSGLWLGLGWLKPQTVFLLIAALLLKGNIRALAGFAITSIILFIGSLALGGSAGMRAFADLLLSDAQRSPPQLMSNWKMLAVNISLLSGTSTEWLYWGGTLVTIALGLYLWQKVSPKEAPLSVQGLVALLSAETLSAPHFSTPTMLIFLPLIAYSVTMDKDSERHWGLWMALGIVLRFLALLYGGFLVTEAQSKSVYFLLLGLSGFLPAVQSLIWAGMTGSDAPGTTPPLGGSGLQGGEA